MANYDPRNKTEGKRATGSLWKVGNAVKGSTKKKKKKEKHPKVYSSDPRNSAPKQPRGGSTKPQKKQTTDPRNSAPKKPSKPKSKPSNTLYQQRIAQQARSTNVHNAGGKTVKKTKSLGQGFREWNNGYNDKAHSNSAKDASKIAGKINATGGYVQKQTAGKDGNKHQATSQMQKAMSRVQALGEVEKQFHSGKSVYENTKDKKGKHLYTKKQSKEISDYWKGLSRKEKSEFIKKNFGKDWKDLDKELNKEDKKLRKENDARVTKRDATTEDYQKLQNALRASNGRADVMEGMIGEDAMKDWASRTAYDYAKGGISLGAQGFMEGASYVGNATPFRDYYSNAEKNAIEQGRESGAYLAGYGGGVASQFMLGGIGALSSAYAKAGFTGARQLGQMSAKEALKDFTTANLKSLAKQAGREVKYDVIFSSPFDALDAYKMSTDMDGKTDPVEFAKFFGMNVGINAGVGGLISGGGSILKADKINRAIRLKHKLETMQPLDASEEKLMQEILNREGKIASDTGYEQFDAVMDGGKYIRGLKREGGNKRAFADVASENEGKRNSSTIRERERKKAEKNAFVDKALENENEWSKSASEFSNAKKTTRAVTDAIKRVQEGSRLASGERTPNMARQKTKAVSKRIQAVRKAESEHRGTIQNLEKQIKDIETSAKAEYDSVAKGLEKKLKSAEGVLKRKNLKPETIKKKRAEIAQLRKEIKSEQTKFRRKTTTGEITKLRKAVKKENDRYAKALENDRSPQQKPKKIPSATKQKKPEPVKAPPKELSEIDKLRSTVTWAEANLKNAKRAFEEAKGTDGVFRAQMKYYNARKAYNESVQALEDAKKPKKGKKTASEVEDAYKDYLERQQQNKKGKAEPKGNAKKPSSSSFDKYKNPNQSDELKKIAKEIEAKKAVNEEGAGKPAEKKSSEKKSSEKKPAKKSEQPKKSEEQKTAETKPAKEKSKAQIKLDEAEAKVRGAEKYIANSKAKHNGVPSERALKQLEEAEKELKKAKKAYAKEVRAKILLKRSEIDSIVKINSSDAMPKIVSPKEKHAETVVKKAETDVKSIHREWMDKSDRLIGRLWQAVGDELSPFERLANKLDPDTAKLIRATLNRMRTIRSLHAINVAGKSKVKFAGKPIREGVGQVSFDGKRVGDSLDEIFKKAGLKTNGKETPPPKGFDGCVSREYDFDYYCRLKSNLDLLENGDKDHKPFIEGMTIENTKKALEDYEKAYGQAIKDFQKDIVKFAKNDLDYAVDGGLITRASADEMLKRNPNYVPAYRVAEVRNYKNIEQYDEITAQGAFRKRNGSDEDLAPLYGSLIARNAMIMKKTEMNGLLNIIAKSTTLDKVPIDTLKRELSDEELLESIDKVAYVNKNSDGVNVAHYFNAEGKEVEMVIPDDAVKALRQWSGEDQLAFLKWKLLGKVEFGDILRGVAKGNRLFKDLITGWNPIFGAKNVIRDTQTAWVNTQYGVGNYMRNYFRAVSEMSRNGDLYRMYKQNGGQFSTMVKDGGIGFEKLAKLPPMRWLEEINNTLESLPRFAEFCASAEDYYFKHGGKPLGDNLSSAEKAKLIASKMDRKATIIAISDAKEVTVNFARSGQIGRLLNSSLVPYFNPALQGLYKIGKRGQEAFQGHGYKKKGSEEITYSYKFNRKGEVVYQNIGDGLKYIGKLMAIGSGASVLFEIAMQNNEEYQQLSSYTKNTYYCVPLKEVGLDGHFLKIPKARDLSAMSTIPNHLYRASIETPDGTVYDAFKTSWEQVGAVNPFTDNIMSPLWRLHTGKNWYGEPIETDDDKVLIQNGKYNNVWDENTSAIAINIAHNPAIEAYNKGVMKGYENGIYDEKKMIEKILTPKRIDSLLDGYTGMVYDLGISSTSLSAKEYGKLSPFLNNFIVDSVVKNQNSQNFYLKSDKYYKTMAYYENNDLDLSDKKYKEAQAWVQKYGQESSSISRAITEIQMDKDMKPKEKYEYLRKLKKAQGDIQRAGIKGENITVDSIGLIADSIGIDRTFGSDFIMHRSKDKSGKYKDNEWYDDYASMKDTDAYKKANKEGREKLQKDFYTVYKRASKCEMEAGGSTLYPDYMTVAMAGKCTSKNADGKKINKDVKKIFMNRLYESKQKKVNAYVDDYGGNMKTYTKTYKTLQEGKEKLGVEYVKELERGEKSMILAESGKNLPDREYYIADCDKKMTPARWANKDGITSKQIHKFIEKHNINQYTKPEEIQKYIDGEKWIDTDRKRSEVYGLTYYHYGGKTNPYGALPAFNIDGDIGLKGSSGGWGGRGRGRRGGWRHHGRRGHGGGGGSSKKGTGSYQDWLKAQGYASGSTASGQSALTEAFRKKQLKNLKATTGRTKS